MSLLLRWHARQDAKKDARAGTDQGRRLAVARLGARPEFNPTGYQDHGFLAEALQQEQRLEELRDIKFGVHDTDPNRPIAPAPILFIGLVFFGFVEVVAATRLMVLLGAGPQDRLVLGLALASILVALSYCVHNVLDRSLRGAKAVGVVISYGLFLTATALLRLSDITVPGDGPTLVDVMSSIILIMSAAGPAVMVEVCLRALRNSAPNRQYQKRIRQQLRSTERGFRHAWNDLAQVGREQREWDQKHSQYMATYNAGHAKDAAGNGRPTHQQEIES